jgi:hypothetical protein
MNDEYPLPKFLTWSGKNKVKYLIGHIHLTLENSVFVSP